jgi:hypothetical protein
MLPENHPRELYYLLVLAVFTVKPKEPFAKLVLAKSDLKTRARGGGGKEKEHRLTIWSAPIQFLSKEKRKHFILDQSPI